MKDLAGNSPRHFLDEHDLNRNEFNALIANAIELKSSRKRGEIRDSLRNRTLAMIFEKASTRTRTSFEAGMVQLGGHAINLSPTDSQLGRGEPIEDTAKVLSEMVDAALLRTHSHTTIEQFAGVSAIPVINGLSDKLHPCQLLADMQTFFELRGSIEGASITWLGAGNNMCNSYINTARLLGFTLKIACPAELNPDPALLQQSADCVELTEDVRAACEGADALVTDVWASMGQEKDQKKREKDFASHQVNTELMSNAPDAIFLHCLPAKRGQEVTAEVIDGPQSRIVEQAANRMHAQKAILAWLLGDAT